MKAYKGSAPVWKYCFMPLVRDRQSCLAQYVKGTQWVIVEGEGTERARREFTEKGSNIILKGPLSLANLQLHTDWVMGTTVIIWHLLIKQACGQTAHSAHEQKDCCCSHRSYLHTQGLQSSLFPWPGDTVFSSVTLKFGFVLVTPM